MKKSRYIDPAIALAIFIVAAAGGGHHYYSHFGKPMGLLLDWFGPSVMFATGHGLVNPDLAAVPGLQSFLVAKTDSLDAGGIPPDIATLPLNGFQSEHRYLEGAVGILWRLLGISWKALWPLFALFFGASVALAYGLFRQGMNRLLSLLFTALFAVLPNNLAVLPHIRDYSKVPFILAVMLLLAYLIRKPMPRRRLLAWTALLGCVIGIGCGFRMDLLVCLYISLPLLPLALPPSLPTRGCNPLSSRKSIATRAAVVAVMLVAFLIPAWPIVRSINKEEDASPHYVMSGVGHYCDTTLGVGGVPYTFLYQISDQYIQATAVGYAHVIGGFSDPIPYSSLLYAHAGKQWIFRACANFPADFLIRGYASVLRILQRAPMDPGPPVSVPDVFSERFLPVTAPVLAHLATFGPVYAAVALLLISAASFRLGLATLVLIFYFAGYPALQFQMRHYFQLSVLPLWCMGFVWNQGLRGLWALRVKEARQSLLRLVPRRLVPKFPFGNEEPKPEPEAQLPGQARSQMEIWERGKWQWWRPRIQRAAALALLTALGLFLPLGAARAYQYYHVGHLFDQYAAAPLEPLETEAMQSENGDAPYRMLKPKGLFNYDAMSARQKQWSIQTEYLVAEISGRDSTATLLPYYQSDGSPATNLSADLTIPLYGAADGRPTRYYFPVYEQHEDWGWRKFIGLAIRDTGGVHLNALYRVKKPSELPLLLELVLPEHYQDLPRYQTLQPHPLPPYLLGYFARAHNLLANGGFEKWDNALPGRSDAPAGFYAPNGSSVVSKESDLVAEGQAALRQTWQSPATEDTVQQSFLLELPNLEPGASYELFVKARNLSDADVFLAAWHFSKGPDGQMIARRLNDRLVQVLPDSSYLDTNRFQEYNGHFVMQPGDNATVALVPHLSPQTTTDNYPVTVIWDDWRLVKNKR